MLYSNLAQAEDEEPVAAARVAEARADTKANTCRMHPYS